MKTVLDNLKAHKLAEPFLAPVDWKGLGIYHYPEIITRPMDLSTVSNKLGKDSYRYVEKFFSDLELIWSNC